MSTRESKDAERPLTPLDGDEPLVCPPHIWSRFMPYLSCPGKSEARWQTVLTSDRRGWLRVPMPGLSAGSV